ncbi:YagK/YfjJ domain-containing protein [Marinobacter vinifirmus]|uniref:YagK/YfjJ domain-containing protein n=1 Tax=Marinobacter vinifirmus TaxID=355591 RepID=UPI003B5A459A
MEWVATFSGLRNRDVYHQIGSPCSPQENLATRISRAWHSALGLEWNRNCPLIHIPDQPQYWVDRDDVPSLHRAFRRGSYLCKSDSKHYGDGMRSFGASRS